MSPLRSSRIHAAEDGVAATASEARRIPCVNHSSELWQHPAFTKALAQPKRPLVAIVRGRDGEAVDGDFLDLGMKLENGQYPCTITGSVDPRELGIVVPEHLLA